MQSEEEEEDGRKMRRTVNDAGRGMKAKRGANGRRRNILELAGDAEDVLSVALRIKTETERRNKKTQTTCRQSTERRQSEGLPATAAAGDVRVAA